MVLIRSGNQIKKYMGRNIFKRSVSGIFGRQVHFYKEWSEDPKISIYNEPNNTKKLRQWQRKKYYIIDPWCRFKKLFKVIINFVAQQTISIVTACKLHPGQIFVGKAGADPSGVPYVKLHRLSAFPTKYDRNESGFHWKMS